MHRAAVAGFFGAALTAAWTSSAAAEPQWNVGAITGVCGVGADGSYWQDTCWFNGLRADLMLGRSRNSDFGIGPHLEATTAGFEDARLGGGLSLHLPIDPYFPVVLSGSAYARRDDEMWEPGVGGYFFIGSRSFNFHSSYVMAGGLLVGLHQGLGDTRENAIIIAAQIDGLILALPFLLGYQWLRGPPDE